MRLVHFVTHPVQYFAPLYRAISSRCSDDFEFEVLFGSDYGTRDSYDAGFGRKIMFDTPLLEGYRSRFLGNRGSGTPDGRYANFDCPELRTELRRGRVDAVWIHGWGYKAQWQAIRAARQAGIPYYVRAETSAMTRSSNLLRAVVGRWLVRRMLWHAAGCLYVGQSNRQFLRSMGVPESRLFPAHYSIDTQFFRSRTVSGEQRSAVRARFGADDATFVLIIAAKAIPLKRIQDAIAATGRAAASTQLWVVGDGSERPRLEQLADTLAPGRVHWLGFVNQSEMPSILSSADATVLCSTGETWGLALHEGLACGLPALATDRVGCALDLVRTDVTGYTYPVGDVAALTECVRRLANDRVRCRQLGENGQRLVCEQYDVQTAASQIVAAVRPLAGQAV